jgi:hypothetical protein
LHVCCFPCTGPIRTLFTVFTLADIGPGHHQASGWDVFFFLIARLICPLGCSSARLSVKASKETESQHGHAVARIKAAVDPSSQARSS